MNLIQNRMTRIVDAKLIYTLGCLAAILIFFQANFQFNSFLINLNLADVLAICGLSIALLHNYYNDGLKFRIPFIRSFILASSGIYLLSFLIGWYKFGFTNFAFVSKFVGFYILLGYAALGAIFVRFTGTRGLIMLAKIMVAVMITILCIKICINILYSCRIYRPDGIFNASLSGYAMNRNAFALQLLCLASLLLALNKKQDWVVSFLLACIYFTYSRSAMITAIALFVTLLVCRLTSFKQVMRHIMQVAFIIVALFLLEIACKYLIVLFMHLTSNDGGTLYGMFAPELFSKPTSNAQRIYSLLEGLKLWIANPLFGIGLGGFVNHELVNNDTFLVIHNTFLWMLVEFGIVGASVFFWYGFMILKHLLNLAQQIKPMQWQIQDRLLFNLIIVFALMANVHEIFYQRIVWFLLGTALVAYRRDAMLT